VGDILEIISLSSIILFTVLTAFLFIPTVLTNKNYIYLSNFTNFSFKIVFIVFYLTTIILSLLKINSQYSYSINQFFSNKFYYTIILFSSLILFISFLFMNLNESQKNKNYSKNNLIEKFLLCIISIFVLLVLFSILYLIFYEAYCFFIEIVSLPKYFL
jgi:hypothetical protein